MSAFDAIELEKLPPPSITEPLSFESVKEDMLNSLRALSPDYTAIVESDPAYKLLEVASYRELLQRQRINDACKGVMLSHAIGTDLDHLAALFGVGRKLVTAGDPNAIPVVPVYETDSDFRKRIQLSFEGHTTAGSAGSYVFWSLSANGIVKDVDVQSPAPGEVVVTVLSKEGNGAASAQLLAEVFEAINADEIRPITDHVSVQSANILEYQIHAKLYFYRGPDPTVIAELCRQKITEYVEVNHLLGHDITISGLYAALHQQGVQRVELVSPAGTLVIGSTDAAYCTSILIEELGVDE